MAKSLCKYRRVELADQFATISQIVSVPNYMCSSCARVAAKKAYLCKPCALSRPAAVSAVPLPASSSCSSVVADDAESLAPVAQAVHQAALAVTDAQPADTPLTTTPVTPVTPVSAVSDVPAVITPLKAPDSLPLQEAESPSLSKSSRKKLKKLKKAAKKKQKSLKKAAKAVQHYEKVLRKVKKALALT
ncbi:hypothetical protein ACFFLZ_19405 [Photobacterium aphoticum]|uniref:Uncharacterized protein n=1 Tax=Photobacterium aphoticum TaxID=754436 RepID=A0A0J1GNM7_9GAMM|nr:hypothetical protein [Photobacterium aphoticum]KLV01363.1 hypothetical protein ABT58_08200 [Photobacterium aphoticum]PSU53391.1 hypothetical protein C9I90_20860 [Photobacterium aphoticum]GHA61205.1 hypothetical protein GCM10007086_38690 [Photobacterium aphoticum]